MTEGTHTNTVCFYDDVFLDHIAPIDHPECPERLRSVIKQLENSGIWDELDIKKPPRADTADIAIVHKPQYISAVEQKLMRGISGYLDLGDTYYSPGTYNAAFMAVGAGIDLCTGIMESKWLRGLALVRPPGHHAEKDQAMGFCLFNNIAVAAASVINRFPDKKVAIIDFDVHHGNGTQNIFYKESRVLYCSIHQSPLYPGTGHIDENGLGEAFGTNINIPLPPLSGDVDWVYSMIHGIIPVMEKFQPDIILVSAGYDAHKLDHISSHTVTDNGFALMHSILVKASEKLCEGRIGVFMEGGYHLGALATGMNNFAQTLCNKNVITNFNFETQPAHTTVDTVSKVIGYINSRWDIKLKPDMEVSYELY